MHHNNLLRSAAALLIACASHAQQRQEAPADTLSRPFRRWSLEAQAGTNKAVRPYSDGYFSSDAATFIGFSGANHFEAGVRFMPVERFGVMLDAAYDRITNHSGSGSLPFDTRQYRMGLQGVANMGRLLKFEGFTRRIGLLAHAGVQASYVLPKEGGNEGRHEWDGGVIFGLEPQVRLADFLSANADFSVISNIRQHFNWDGSYTAQADNLTGLMYNVSVGLSFYLGEKGKPHADWYFDDPSAATLTQVQAQQRENRKRIDEVEAMLQDTDRDGVPDYLDVQNNTPSGVAVDAKGRYLDVNNNGIPDELEPGHGRDGKDAQGIARSGRDGQGATQSDALRELVAGGYLNVFYKVDRDVPDPGSSNNIYHIIRYLKKYPQARAILTGYADRRGDEKANRELSQRRARKLYDIIVASGIDPQRVSITGQGVDESFPDSPTGRQLARRVSITLE